MNDFVPFGTRFTMMDGSVPIYVIEQPPQIQEIHVLDPASEYFKKKYLSYHVAIPWQYFIVKPTSYNGVRDNFVNTRLFWARHRIKSLDDKVIPARLPNINYGSPYDPYVNHQPFKCLIGNICWGSVPLTNDSSVAGQIENAVKAVFNTAFSSNRSGWNYPIAYKSFEEWAEASESDPFCYLSWREWEGECPQTAYDEEKKANEGHIDPRYILPLVTLASLLPLPPKVPATKALPAKSPAMEAIEEQVAIAEEKFGLGGGDYVYQCEADWCLRMIRDLDTGNVDPGEGNRYHPECRPYKSPVSDNYIADYKYWQITPAAGGYKYYWKMVKS